MILIILIVLIFSSVLIVKSYKNKFKWSIGIYILGITLLLFSSLLYFTKKSPSFSPYGIESYIFSRLLTIKVNIPSIMLLHTLGLATVMVSSFCFIITFKKVNPVLLSGFTAHIIFFVWLNTYKTQFSLYVFKYYSQETPSRALSELLIKSAVGFTYITLFLYLILPLLTLMRYYKKNTVYLKKRYVMASSSILLLLDAVFLWLFVFGPFSACMPSKTLIVKNIPEILSARNYMFLSLALCLFLIITFVLLLYFNPFDRKLMFSRLTISKNTEEINKNLQMLLHTYKNLFFTISQLSDQANKHAAGEASVVSENLRSIYRLSDNSVKGLSKTLDTLKRIKKKVDRIDISEIIAGITADIDIPPGIELITVSKTPLTEIYGDGEQIKDVFKNILVNAVESIISSSADSSGYIKIITELDDDYLVVTVLDNGGGIDKANYGNIFKPLFSTKQNLENWGVGLSYAKQVILAHLGAIFVGTTDAGETYFQILFPSITKKETKLPWKKSNS